jgi:hypothetical protein
MDTSSTLNLWGDPVADAPYWREQQRDYSCAVVAQVSAYESITGKYISEEEACQFATSQGWLTEEGSPYEHIGNLLNQLDVATYRTYGATLDDIKTALANDEKVMVSLDANEIWFPIWNEARMPVDQADDAMHTVWVIGVAQELDGTYQLLLNDSGIPNGQVFTVDYEDFENAWQDADSHLVVADTLSGWLIGSQGSDEMVGTNDIDWFDGAGGADWLDGGDSNDILLGGMGSDTLIGGDGTDELRGGSGNDLLIGGRVLNSSKAITKVKDDGKDILVGGLGQDIFALGRGPDRDIIKDFKNGTDRLGLTAGIKYGQLDFAQKGNNTIISLGNDQLAILQGVKVDQISRADFTTVYN